MKRLHYRLIGVGLRCLLIGGQAPVRTASEIQRAGAAEEVGQ